MNINLYRPYTLIVACLTILCLAGNIQAQMFSVSSEQERIITLPTNRFYAGYEPVSFRFRPENVTPRNRLDFDEPVYRLRAELTGFQGYIGYGRSLGENANVDYFNAGAILDGEYRFVRQRSFFVVLPLLLKTDYLLINSRDETERVNDFRQSSAMVGVGIGAGVRPANRIRLTSRIVPHYGFSVTSFGGTGGSRSALISQNRLYLDHLFNQVGISVGYDFQTSRFNLDDERFNYDLSSHSFIFGITF